MGGRRQKTEFGRRPEWDSIYNHLEVVNDRLPTEHRLGLSQGRVIAEGSGEKKKLRMAEEGLRTEVF